MFHAGTSDPRTRVCTWCLFIYSRQAAVKPARRCLRHIAPSQCCARSGVAVAIAIWVRFICYWKLKDNADGQQPGGGVLYYIWISVMRIIARTQLDVRAGRYIYISIRIRYCSRIDNFILRYCSIRYDIIRDDTFRYFPIFDRYNSIYSYIYRYDKIFVDTIRYFSIYLPIFFETIRYPFIRYFIPIWYII